MNSCTLGHVLVFLTNSMDDNIFFKPPFIDQTELLLRPRLSAGVLPTPTARAWQAARGLGPHAHDAQGSRMSEQAAVHALPGHGGSTSGRLGRIGAGTGDPDHVINVPMHRWVTSSRRGMTKNPCLHP